MTTYLEVVGPDQGQSDTKILELLYKRSCVVSLWLVCRQSTDFDMRQSTLECVTLDASAVLTHKLLLVNT